MTALSTFKPYGNSDSDRYCMAAGSESGVVSLYDVAGMRSPEGVAVHPARALLNLTTKITSMAAHPSGEILAYASDEVSWAYSKKMDMFSPCFLFVFSFSPSPSPFPAFAQKRDQLRLVHVDSSTVFENWPTGKTPLRRVSCMEFSPRGDLMAVGNNRGRVLLYQLNHFSNISS